MAESPPKGEKKVRKLDAVEQAMKALGKDATREQLRGYVKGTFGYDMTVDHVSNCKGDLAKRAKKKTAAKKAAAPKAAPQKATAPAQLKPAATAGNNGRPRTVALEDVLALKALVDRVGADGLRQLIAAFER
jgi:hypothetical protein